MPEAVLIYRDGTVEVLQSKPKHESYRLPIPRSRFDDSIRFKEFILGTTTLFDGTPAFVETGMVLREAQMSLLVTRAEFNMNMRESLARESEMLARSCDKDWINIAREDGTGEVSGAEEAAGLMRLTTRRLVLLHSHCDPWLKEGALCLS